MSAPHPAVLALAEATWAARQPVQAPPPAPESIQELIADAWAAQARLDAAQAEASAALARLAT